MCVLLLFIRFLFFLCLHYFYNFSYFMLLAYSIITITVLYICIIICNSYYCIILCGLKGFQGLNKSINQSINQSINLSLSLSLHLINYYVIYNASLFSEGFIFYGFKFIVECKRHEKIESRFFSKIRILYNKKTRGSL